MATRKQTTPQRATARRTTGWWHQNSTAAASLLTELLSRKQISANDLANNAKVALKTVYRYLNGSVRYPRIDTLKLLLQALDSNTEEFRSLLGQRRSPPLTISQSPPAAPSLVADALRHSHSSYESAPDMVPIASRQELLRAWGVRVHDHFTDDFLSRLGAVFAIDDAFVDCAFGGFRGVNADHLIPERPTVHAPNLPDYVYDVRATIPVPDPSRTKAYLSSWTAGILDKHNKVHLDIGRSDERVPSGLYDYRTTKAVVASATRIQHDVLEGTIDLKCLARRLDLAVLVATSDDKLVLALRTEGPHGVDNLAGTWMASVGESVDGDVDRNDMEIPDPRRTLIRNLTEEDELNLAASDIQGAEVTYLGLATEWAYFWANLLPLVKLRVHSKRVLDRAVHGEHSRVEVVDFTPTACLPLVRFGLYSSPHLRGARSLGAIPRIALLLGLFSRFGYDEIMSRIAVEVQQGL